MIGGAYTVGNQSRLLDSDSTNWLRTPSDDVASLFYRKHSAESTQIAEATFLKCDIWSSHLSFLICANRLNAGFADGVRQSKVYEDLPSSSGRLPEQRYGK